MKRISPRTLAKLVGLGAGAYFGGPLLAGLGGQCGSFIGTLFADDDDDGWGLADTTSGLLQNIFANKVQSVFEGAPSDFNHDLRRAAAQALIDALAWEKKPGPFAAALLKTPGFKGMNTQRQQLLRKFILRWQSHISTTLAQAEKQKDATLLDSILPPTPDLGLIQLGDSQLTAETATAQAWSSFYEHTLQPVLQALENQDELKAFNLDTLQRDSLTSLAAVFPGCFAQVLKTPDHQRAWIAFQKTLLQATQRAVHDIGAQTQRLPDIERKVDLLVENDKASKELEKQLTTFLSVVKPTLEGHWKETKEVKAIVTSLQGQLVSLHEDVQKISPLALYKEALFDAYACYLEIGHPITGGTTLNTRQALIGDIFVDPCCSAERVSPARMEAAIEAGGSPLGSDLLSLMQEIFTSPGHRRLVLLGDPGMGKSTLVRWLTVSPLLTAGRRKKAKVLPHSLPGCLKNAIPLPFIVRDLVRHLPDEPAEWDWEAITLAFREFRATSTAVRPLLSAYEGHDPAFESLLEDPNALFLIDGLDEIGDPSKRAAMSAAIMEGFAKLPRARFLITSRFVGYEEAPVHKRVVKAGHQAIETLVPGGDAVVLHHPTHGLVVTSSNDAEKYDTEWARGKMTEGTTITENLAHLLQLTPFNDAQQDTYARLWFSVRVGETMGKDRATALMSEARRKKSIRIISRVPNLLCMMALLKVHGVPLPDGRAELYAAISRAYLDTIQEALGLSARWHGHELPCSREQAEKWLAIIAMHLQLRRVGFQKESPNRKPDRDEEGQEFLAKQSELLDWLQPVFAADKPGVDPQQLLRDFLRFITQRTAFLLERGEGQFGFAHLSFLEYYAACWLETEFRRLLNQRKTKPWQHPGLHLEKETFSQHAQQSLWHEPLHFLAEILSKNEDDAQSLFEWMFPWFPPVADFHAAPSTNNSPQLDSARLLAVLTQDRKVSFSTEHRRRIWAHLWLHWLAHQQILGGGLFDGWNIAPDLLGVSDFKAGIIDELRQCLLAFTHLRRLNLRGCTGLNDLSPLKDFSRLQTLDLTGCTGLNNISPLKDFKSLQSLSLRGCTGLSDLSPLRDFNSLQSLDLTGCTGLSDLSPLKDFISLQRLDLTGCTGLSDLSPLKDFKSLQTLTLAGCTGLSDLSPLKDFKSLQTLDLANCTRISDLSPLKDLKSLQTLFLNDCTRLSDLFPLKNLNSLRTLILTGNTGLIDLNPLKDLNSLWMLIFIGCTGLSDLSPLKNLNSLETLFLNDCSGISDLSPLKDLNSLQTLTLTGCTGLSDLESQIGALKKALPKCNIHC